MPNPAANVVALLALAPDELVDLLVRDLYADLVRRRVQHQLARDGLLCLGAQAGQVRAGRVDAGEADGVCPGSATENH